MHFNILFADDKINNLDSLISDINSLIPNLCIQTASNYEQILLNITNTDLLIISTTFNNEDCYSFIKKIKNSDLNVIFLTNDAKSEKEINQACEIGYYDFISKPIHIKKLEFKIRNYASIRKNELALRKEKELTTAIMNTTSNPIFVTDSDKIIFTNKAFLDLLNLKTIDDINDTYNSIYDIFVSKSTSQADNKLMGQDSNIDWFSNIKNNNQQKVSLKDCKSKEYVYIVNSTPLIDGFTYIVHLNDITKEVEQQEELSSLLYTDNLTSLSNRTKLIEDLQDSSMGIKSIAMLDINSFKEINDFYGHRAGDKILKGIAELIIQTVFHLNDIILYKFPADIYCLASLSEDEERFNNIIKDLISVIDKKVFKIDSYEIDTRITAGMSFSVKNNKLITADLALQAAKRDNKDYLVFFDELDNINEYENNMIWTKKLKHALANDNIIVYYQPLINNATLKVDKYECLVRMIDDDKVVSPFFFLDISKKSNQYSKITKVVIEKSFIEFENLPFEFSVNVSYEDIVDLNFLPFIKEQLSKYDVASRVVFEILEDEGIKDYDILIKFIDEVKSYGCKVAIDDFGSGYSNFEHLLKMNIDFLKIDASLIKNIATDENSYKVTKTIIDFARNLNLKTIAEFVENKEIFDIVKELGADYSQGYYFSAPISVPNIYNCEQDS